MINYIINDKTVALLKKDKETIVYNINKKKIINSHVNKILDFNCMLHGSSLNGRIKSVKNILHIKYKVPILISESDNIILIQLNAFRDAECLFIVANKIVDYMEIDDMLIIKCVNNIEFNVKISKYSFEKMLINTIKLNNYLKWSKNVNFV